MKIVSLNTIVDLQKVNLDVNVYYFWFPFGLGDLYIVSLLKTEIERILHGKIIFIIQEKHHLILDVLGIDYISIAQPCRTLTHIANNQSNIPKKGFIYGAHPLCNNPSFIHQLKQINGVQWYKKYFSIDDTYEIENSKYILSVDCSISTQQKIYAVCGKKVKDITLFIPDAFSANIQQCIYAMNAIINSMPTETILYNSVKNIQLNNAINVQMTLSELLEVCFNCKRVYSVRNGICDVIHSIGDRLTIFYDKETYKSWAVSQMFNNNFIHEIII